MTSGEKSCTCGHALAAHWRLQDPPHTRLQCAEYPCPCKRYEEAMTDAHKAEKPALCPVCGSEHPAIVRSFSEKFGWHFAGDDEALHDGCVQCTSPFHTAKESQADNACACGKINLNARAYAVDATHTHWPSPGKCHLSAAAQPSECPECGDAEVALMWTNVQSRYHPYMTWHRGDERCESHQCVPCQNSYHAQPEQGEAEFPARREGKSKLVLNRGTGKIEIVHKPEPSPDASGVSASALHPGALEVANEIMDKCQGVDEGAPWFSIEDTALLITEFVERETAELRPIRLRMNTERSILAAGKFTREEICEAAIQSEAEIMQLEAERDTLRAENLRLREVLQEVYDNPPQTLRLHDQHLTCAWCGAEAENDCGTQCPMQDVEQELLGSEAPSPTKKEGT